jgi:glycine hydroxymethyltransferase
MSSNGFASATAPPPRPPPPTSINTYKGKSLLRDPVAEVDPEVYELLKKEKKRQRTGIQLIASENFTSRAVSETLSSAMANKYSEGYPGVRFVFFFVGN